MGCKWFQKAFRRFLFIFFNNVRYKSINHNVDCWLYVAEEQAFCRVMYTKNLQLNVAIFHFNQSKVLVLFFFEIVFFYSFFVVLPYNLISHP